MNQDVLTPRIRRFMDIQRKKDISEFIEKLKKLELRCVGSGSQYWQNRIIELQIEYQEKLQ